MLSFVVAGAQGHDARIVAIRVESTTSSGFRLYVTNVSERHLDYPVRVTVRLTRLDDTRGAEHGHLIGVTSIQAQACTPRCPRSPSLRASCSSLDR
jgi:hypothetical protein